MSESTSSWNKEALRRMGHAGMPSPRYTRDNATYICKKFAEKVARLQRVFRQKVEMCVLFDLFVLNDEI